MPLWETTVRLSFPRLAGAGSSLPVILPLPGLSRCARWALQGLLVSALRLHSPQGQRPRRLTRPDPGLLRPAAGAREPSPRPTRPGAVSVRSCWPTARTSSLTAARASSPSNAAAESRPCRSTSATPRAATTASRRTGGPRAALRGRLGTGPARPSAGPASRGVRGHRTWCRLRGPEGRPGRRPPGGALRRPPPAGHDSGGRAGGCPSASPSLPGPRPRGDRRHGPEESEVDDEIRDLFAALAR